MGKIYLFDELFEKISFFGKSKEAWTESRR